MIKETYCSFEVSMMLKEKGFNTPCSGRYSVHSKEFHLDCTKMCNNGGLFECAAPTHQMAMAYLREKGIHISPKYCCFQGPKKNDKPYYKWEDRVLKLPTGEQIHPDVLGIHEYYSSYEEAVEAALKYVLENLI